MLHRIKDVVRELRERSARRRLVGRPGTKIDPSAKVQCSRLTSRLPAGLTIGARSIVQCWIVGERSTAIVEIGADTFIGNSKLLCASSISIGNDVMIAWGCTVVDHHSHALQWEHRKNDVRDTYAGSAKDWTNVRVAPIRICDKAWIGFDSIILAGVTIGEGAVVGCGSIVTKDVPPYAVVAGNPARIIRQNTPAVPTSTP